MLSEANKASSSSTRRIGASLGSAEEVKVHVLFLLLNNCLLFGCSWRRSATTSAWSCCNGVGCSICGWIVQEFLDFLNLLEGEGDISNECRNIPEGISECVWQACFSGNAELAAESCHIVDTSQELGDENVIGDVQHSRREDTAILKDLFNNHLVGEGLDGQLCEQHGGTCRDLLTFLQDLEIGNQLDLAFDNLGGNVQGLEKGRLRRVHTSGSGWQIQVHHGNLASLG